MKVTFDKNVYEYIIDPEKPGNQDGHTRQCYRDLHELIVHQKITPFVSETVFTCEALRKGERKKVLSRRDKLNIETEGERFRLVRTLPYIRGMSLMITCCSKQLR